MIFVVLLQNVALLIALSVAQQLIEARWAGGPLGRQLLSGLLFGAVAISGMLTPLKFSEGVIFDGRSIVLSIAGLFGGPVVAVTAAAIATAFRLWLGGGGAMVGVLTIIESSLLGVVFYYVRREYPWVVSAWGLWGFGVLVHVVMLVLFLGLPGNPMRDTLPRITAPILIFYPLGVMLIGRFLAEQENRYLQSIVAGEGTEISSFLVENTLDCIWLTDMDFTFRYVNPAVEQLFGYTVDEFLGTNLMHHVDKAHLQEITARLEQAIQGLPHNPSVRLDTELLKRDGTPLPVEVIARLVLDDDGRPTALYGSTRDVSDRRRMEIERQQAREELERLVSERTEDLEAANAELLTVNEELLRTNEQLNEASDAKNRFLRAMSHELRTPLNSIIGFSDILAKGIAGPVTEEQRRQAEMINHSGQHLLALINDILDLSRIEADKLQFEFESFDLAALAEEILHSIATEADVRGLETKLDAPTTLVMVKSDPLKVRQILLNLVGNAVKFTQQGRITVRVHPPNQSMLAVDVIDTGPGIPPEQRDRIFEEFVQGGPHDEASQAGSGLGLAIARGLARALGGTIMVESEVGSGSTFTLLLPHRP